MLFETRYSLTRPEVFGYPIAYVGPFLKHLHHFQYPFLQNPGYKKAPLRIVRGLLKKAATYSPTWYSSTIGANGLNFPVRNGKGWAPSQWPPKNISSRSQVPCCPHELLTFNIELRRSPQYCWHNKGTGTQKESNVESLSLGLRI